MGSSSPRPHPPERSEPVLASDPGARALEELLRRTHLSAPSDLAAVAADAAREAAVRELVIYIVDYELKTLVAVPAPDAAGREPLSVQGTVAGRVFRTIEVTAVELEPVGDGGRGVRLWLPLLDGTERLGVVEMILGEAQWPLREDTLVWAERYVHLVAMLMVSKGAFSDLFTQLRRRERATIASELIRELVPPLVFATDDLIIAGLLEPAYDNGGDALDYALNDGVLHFAVFDAMGHGLAAAGVAAFALSAYRHSRRHDAGLADTYAAMDAAVAAQYPNARFVTALLAQLEVTSGRLRWMSAGHPAPLLLRGGRLVRALETAPVPPIGLRLATGPAQEGEESLEPGDLVLLYTDGLTEARRPGGDLFTVERLAEFIERQAAAEQTAPETLRRLREAMIDREEGALRDDATALLLEWRTGGQKALIPETA